MKVNILYQYLLSLVLISLLVQRSDAVLSSLGPRLASLFSWIPVPSLPFTGRVQIDDKLILFGQGAESLGDSSVQSESYAVPEEPSYGESSYPGVHHEYSSGHSYESAPIIESYNHHQEVSHSYESSYGQPPSGPETNHDTESYQPPLQVNSYSEEDKHDYGGEPEGYPQHPPRMMIMDEKHHPVPNTYEVPASMPYIKPMPIIQDYVNPPMHHMEEPKERFQETQPQFESQGEYENMRSNEPQEHHPEIFSYNPYVEGEGFDQDQASYNGAPLSKDDIARYAEIYRYDWNENEKRSSSGHSSPEDVESTATSSRDSPDQESESQMIRHQKEDQSNRHSFQTSASSSSITTFNSHHEPSARLEPLNQPRQSVVVSDVMSVSSSQTNPSIVKLLSSAIPSSNRNFSSSSTSSLSSSVNKSEVATKEASKRVASDAVVELLKSSTPRPGMEFVESQDYLVFNPIQKDHQLRMTEMDHKPIIMKFKLS